jgi:hypothetical protein
MRITHATSWTAAVFAAATILVTFLEGTASAQSHPWTTVGSAGVVDEDDAAIVEFVLGEARVPAVAPADSVLDLRYNVVSLEGFDGPGFWLMRVRFRDNGNAARVQLNLRQYNAGTGITSTLHSFDSDAYPPAVGYQTRAECFAINWDFAAGPYFIDASLTKSAAGGQPALGTIQIVPGNCEP